VTNDASIAASKEDIRLLMEQMGAFQAKTEEQIADLREEMVQWKSEIVHEFRVIAEELRHDLIGTHKDKISNYEDRLVRLERHAGLQAV
jgi:hypothetical protein